MFIGELKKNGLFFMKRYTLKIEKDLLKKMKHVSKYNGRTVSSQLEYLMKKYVDNFEKVNGEISEQELKRFLNSKK